MTDGQGMQPQQLECKQPLICERWHLEAADYRVFAMKWFHGKAGSAVIIWKSSSQQVRVFLLLLLLAGWL